MKRLAFLALVAGSLWLACATGPTLAPLPPLPGPDVNDWSVKAPELDKSCYEIGCFNIVWDKNPDDAGVRHGRCTDSTPRRCGADGGAAPIDGATR